ncbi:unnamed protein product [Cuscuta epithymum]|uniref:Uncharacterized protein n=1 Tax=Cuscuta epithymum TaxID=186058 RepID=A0AAV0EUC0_9ASTE|nr:unnamed protein product [Cuscuta epithymum]
MKYSLNDGPFFIKVLLMRCALFSNRCCKIVKSVHGLFLLNFIHM